MILVATIFYLPQLQLIMSHTTSNLDVLAQSVSAICFIAGSGAFVLSRIMYAFWVPEAVVESRNKADYANDAILTFSGEPSMRDKIFAERVMEWEAENDSATLLRALISGVVTVSALALALSVITALPSWTNA